MSGAQLALALDESFPLDAAVCPAHDRHLCARCQSRPARFSYRGVVKADRTHTLCFRCYRAALDAVRTVRVREVRAGFSRTLGGQLSALPSIVMRPGEAARADADGAHQRAEMLSLRRRRAQIAARHALEA
jgi:hypothetical protein